MRRIAFLITLVLILPCSFPALADRPDKNVLKEHKERQREKRKYYEEHEREDRKYREEQKREDRKHKRKMEREYRKYRKEQKRESRKHHRKMEREKWKHHKAKHKHHKHKKLPSDWRKRVYRGRHVDDDIYVHLEPVPKVVIRTLPPLPPGFSYRKIEDDIIKLKNANREIIDVFKRGKVPAPPLPRLPGIK